MADSATDRTRPRLTVAMVVCDEQQVIGETIESIRAIAEEIVVLDTGSADQTVALARRLGATVHESAWTDDFADARNRCWRYATGDFVLWLNAGERLDAEAATELRRFLDHEADPAKAYAVWVEMPPRSEHAAPEQVVQLRLIPNRPDLLYVGRVRETLQPSIDAAGLGVATATGRILCHPRGQRPDRREARAKRNLRLANLDLVEADRESAARLWLVVGDAQGDLEQKEESRQAYGEALEAAETDATESLEAFYGLLTTCGDDSKGTDAAMRICLEALDAFPLDAQLLLAMGNILQRQGRMDLAARSYQAAVEHGQVDLEVWHLKDLADVAADYLNLSLQILGQDDRALAFLERGLEQRPASSRLRRRLVELHVKHGRCDEALSLAGPLAAGPAVVAPLADAIRGACRAAAKDWQAALSLLRRASAAGCHDPLCLRWLAVALLATGQIDAARPVLEEWCRVDPSSAEAQGYLAAMGPVAESPEAQPAMPGRQFRLDRAGQPSTESPRQQTPGVERAVE